MLQFLSFLPVISSIIGKIFGNKKDRDDAMARIKELELRGQLEPLLKQIEVNIEEAKSGSVFIAGWRPYTGWMCAGALTLGFIFTVILPTILVLLPLFGVTDMTTYVSVIKQLQNINLGIYVTILMGMLGLGTMRVYEKSRGITDSFTKEIKTISADKFLRLYSKKFRKVSDTHREIIYKIFDKIEKDK